MKGAQDPRPFTRPSLILRIRDPQDAAAWTTFLETYAPLVHAYCRRKGLQDSDAADVTQEVMAQSARSAGDFEYRSERGRFRDWLGTITRHKIVNHFRTNRRAMSGKLHELEDDSGQTPEGDPGPEWAAEFNARVLQTALARIRPDFEPATWQAFTLVWIEHCPAAEAARSLGVPVENIYVAKSRALKRLREEVMALAEDLPLSIPPR